MASRPLMYTAGCGIDSTTWRGQPGGSDDWLFSGRHTIINSPFFVLVLQVFCPVLHPNVLVTLLELHNFTSHNQAEATKVPILHAGLRMRLNEATNVKLPKQSEELWVHDMEYNSSLQAARSGLIRGRPVQVSPVVESAPAVATSPLNTLRQQQVRGRTCNDFQPQ